MKKFLIRLNARFSVLRRNHENSSKTPPFLLHDRVWGKWVQQLLWRLPRKIEYLPSSHYLEDNAVHIRKVRRNAFQRSSRLLQQYPRKKERYTVQFKGDDRSIPQVKRKRWLVLLNYRTSELTPWEPLKNLTLSGICSYRLSNAILKNFCQKTVSNL